MYRDNFNLILGDDHMALYKNGDLVVEGVTLTFGDILEACRIPCQIQTADLDWSIAMNKARKGYPSKLKDVPIEPEKEAAHGEESEAI